MSTSQTVDQSEIVIYEQLELLTKTPYWAVEVWQNYEFLESDNSTRAQCLWSNDNFDFDKKQLNEETLESLVAQAVDFIKGEQK